MCDLPVAGVFPRAVIPMLRRAAVVLAILLCGGLPEYAQTALYPPIYAPMFRASDANGNLPPLAPPRRLRTSRSISSRALLVAPGGRGNWMYGQR